MIEKIRLSEARWKEILTPEQYRVMRERGTEPAFCGLYTDMKKPGAYHCAACDLPLFSAREKFDSGTGWPSYFQPISPENVEYYEDTSLGMTRTEVVCARCDSHLGHVFDDGPPPIRKRYCINSIALRFVPDGPEKE